MGRGIVVKPTISQPILWQRSFWLPLLIWAVIVALALFVYAQTLRDDRQAALDKGREAAQAAADLGAQHAARMFESTDAGLIGVSTILSPFDWDRLAGDRATWQVVRQWADRLGSVPRIIVADQNGMLRLHSDTFPAPARSLAERDYFQAHQTGSGDHAVIGLPIVGLVSGQRIFTLSRRLTHADGSFAGIVNANLPPETFEVFYRAVGLPPDSFMALSRLDGVLLARFPVVESAVGSRLDYGRLLPTLAAGAPSGIDETVSPFDGLRRFVAFQRVPGHDAFVFAGLSVDAILDVWHRNMIRSSAILGAAIMGLTVLLIALLIRHRHEVSARQALRASESRYGQLFDQMLSAFAVHQIILDSAGKPVDYRFIEVNPAFERLTGLSRDKAVGRCVTELLPGIEQFWIDQYGAVALTGQPAQFTYRSDMLGRDFEVAAFSPGPGRFACIFNDVTERERREADLHQAITHLADQNAELQRFAYVASHDLQEPLRSIVTFTQMLQRRLQAQEDPEIKQDMDFVIGAAKRMNFLINDLLAYSRISSKGVAFAEVDMSLVCRDALDNLRESILESGAVIEVAPLPAVFGDGIQLMQLMQNLIANAIKFTQPGEPPSVAVGCREQDGETVFFVSDRGIGVGDTEQDIFEIFRRLHPHQDYPGTGVGLAICRKIVQHHHGRIWFENGCPRGTTFLFTLNPQAAGSEQE